MKPAAEAFKIEKYKKASDALAAALRIISRPNRWTQGALAVYFEGGEKIECSSKAGTRTAEAFCALGAVEFVNGPAQKSAIGYLREAGKVIRVEYGGYDIPSKSTFNGDIFYVNDDLGFEQTRKMFKLAIKNARKAGK